MWYRDRGALRWIATRYLPWLFALNLAWEAAHVRLYTLWQEADAAYVAFSVVHCTLGDVLIGGAALLLALILSRERGLPQWRWSRVGALTVLIGIAYTVFSEWMNITLLRSWAYTRSMPVLEIGGFEVGLTPLAQWLVLPPLALYLGRAALSPADRGA
jgi:hypothetical protein